MRASFAGGVAARRARPTHPRATYTQVPRPRVRRPAPARTEQASTRRAPRRAANHGRGRLGGLSHVAGLVPRPDCTTVQSHNERCRTSPRHRPNTLQQALPAPRGQSEAEDPTQRGAARSFPAAVRPREGICALLRARSHSKHAPSRSPRSPKTSIRIKARSTTHLHSASFVQLMCAALALPPPAAAAAAGRRRQRRARSDLWRRCSGRSVAAAPREEEGAEEAMPRAPR